MSARMPLGCLAPIHWMRLWAGWEEHWRVTTQFDQHNGVPLVSERYSKRAADMDLERLLKQIHEESSAFKQ